MELDPQGTLAEVLANNRQTALRLFEQLDTQFRKLLVRPKEKRSGSLLEKYKEGVVFNTSPDSNASLFVMLPKLLSVNFEDDDGSNVEIRFDDIVKALQACEDNNWKVAFDKEVLKNATAAIEARNPKQCFHVSMQIREQVSRFKRASALHDLRWSGF